VAHLIGRVAHAAEYVGLHASDYYAGLFLNRLGHCQYPQAFFGLGVMFVLGGAG